MNNKRTAILSIRVPERLKNFYLQRARKEYKSLSDVINKQLESEQEYETNENNNKRE